MYIVKQEDGYRLWMRYDLISNPSLIENYKSLINEIIFNKQSDTIKVALEEMQRGLNGLLGATINISNEISKDNFIIIDKVNNLRNTYSINHDIKFRYLGSNGYRIFSSSINKKKCIIITANDDIGLLYGVFCFLRLIQTEQNIISLDIIDNPKIKLRILNHWDNLDRTVERGYAGSSLWEWKKLPGMISPRYKDYARANASIGINGAVLNNVNSNALILIKKYLIRVASLADIFRPYGIKVYLSVRFSAPIEIANLDTADPYDDKVKEWWINKTDEIYSYIPDFGGFLVKASSEGQPGPQDYGRSHADGANMLADALLPHNGVVIWRAFVYDNDVPEDRAKQAYNEFKPLDGKFGKNVLIQVKNGPIDFQPREPFHPMFGAMPKTPLVMEFQITQEYLGFSTHLVYLAPLFKECLDSDTYAKGKGSYVSKVIDGSLHDQKITGISGVTNIGSDRNWCGHHFAQSNWYAFGRLSWNPYLSSDEIATEWIKMTFNNNKDFIKSVKLMMMESREITVNYMTPLGLHHIMGWDHHFGPGPWINKGRTDWTSVYYHRADLNGIGFDRSSSGSNASGQYSPQVRDKFDNIDLCPENLLLWFHHVPWHYKMKSGRTLWEELCYKYYKGVQSVNLMIEIWKEQKGLIDNKRFKHVKALLKIQEKEAKLWRDACLLYFQTFSKKPIPSKYEKPKKTLKYYMNLRFKNVPGI